MAEGEGPFPIFRGRLRRWLAGAWSLSFFGCLVAVMFFDLPQVAEVSAGTLVVLSLVWFGLWMYFDIHSETERADDLRLAREFGMEEELQDLQERLEIDSANRKPFDGD